MKLAAAALTALVITAAPARVTSAAGPLALTAFDLRVDVPAGGATVHVDTRAALPVKVPGTGPQWACLLIPRDRGDKMTTQSVVCETATRPALRVSATAACANETRDVDVQRLAIGGETPSAILTLVCRTEYFNES